VGKANMPFFFQPENMSISSSVINGISNECSNDQQYWVWISNLTHFIQLGMLWVDWDPCLQGKPVVSPSLLQWGVQLKM
jgi:hypothetical protein